MRTDLDALKATLAAGIPAHELAVLDSGGTHDYRCRCGTCREWWRLMGPNGGDEGDYGPFTEAEVYPEGRAVFLAAQPKVCELCGDPMGEEAGDVHGKCADRETFAADRRP
jgi:hypothetical protein